MARMAIFWRGSSSTPRCAAVRQCCLPSAWILPLKFTGGGLSAPGKMMFDSTGNLWAGDNWLVGAQNQDALWDGNLSKFAPNGKPLSPMVTGFTGGGGEGG